MRPFLALSLVAHLWCLSSQGIPTIVLGVISFFLLPDRPESTKYLTKEERHLAAERMSRGTSRDIGATLNKSKPYLASKLFWSNLLIAIRRAYLGCIPRLAGLSHPPRIFSIPMALMNITTQIDLCGRNHIFRRKLRTRVDFSIPAYNHQNLWL